MDQNTDNTGTSTPAIKKGLRKLIWLKNKYLLAIVAFAVWMFFFDRNDFFSQFERMNRSAELKAMEEKKGKLIAETRKELNLLKTNAQTIEKYARENYLMKKDNEDLFIISASNNDK
jgi:cell division protein FtsB